MTELESLAKLSPQAAQNAVYTLVSGEPPSSEIVDLISVGLERDLRAFEREYFRPTSFLVSPETAGSSFKIVEAYYGGGKTHYLRAVERTAHRHNFATAFVGLRKTECPLTRFDLIYAAVAESLTVPTGISAAPVRGIGSLVREWVHKVQSEVDEPIQEVSRRVDGIGDLPLMSLKVALRTAALACASGDQAQFDEALVYLTSGKVPAGLRKQGVLQAIDSKNGSLALRTVASLVRKLGFAGFVLILDEGDRSLSLVSSKEKKEASNNLVQLINEAAEAKWVSTLLLYSIPSWQSFSDVFSHNMALIQRTEPTGFPQVPPAPRIVLDDRQRTDEERMQFCLALGERLSVLFRAAYPGDLPDAQNTVEAARLIADGVLRYEKESSYRRLFIQSYLAALYRIVDGGTLSAGDVEAIVTRKTNELRNSGE